MQYFEAKVKILKQDGSGLIKLTAEQYLVDALSFTEAEARILAETGKDTHEITIVSLTRSKITEVAAYGDIDLWFKVKVTYTVNDEETEKGKKINLFILVNAGNAEEAYQRTQEHLKEMLVPFEVPQVVESKISEIYERVPAKA